MRLLLVLAGSILLSTYSARAQEAGDAAKGAEYARRNCAECHGVRPVDVESPRPPIATFRAIANTPGMTGTALAVFFRTPHRNMPNLIVAEQDRADLISYILSLRDQAR